MRTAPKAPATPAGQRYLPGLGTPVGALLAAALFAVVPLVKYWFDGFRIDGWPMETSGFPVGRDFANLLAGAVAALRGDSAQMFDAIRHIAEIARLVDPRAAAAGPILIWSYPPTALWLAMPFATFGYTAGLALWTAGGLILLTWAAHAGQTAAPRIETAVLLASAPGVIICVLFGQTALLTSALLIGGLALAERRPMFAGALLAALVVKPHLGLAVPVALIALGAHRAFLATAAFATLYLAGTAAAFGIEPWRLFFAVTLPRQTALFLMGEFHMAEMMISPFFALRSLGIPPPFAMWLHGLIAVASLVGLYLALRRIRDGEQRLAFIALATLLLSPYMQLYELALASLVALRLALAPIPLDDATATAERARLVLLLAVTPVVTLVVASATGINPAPWLVIAAMTWIAADNAAARA